jgi:hypothetical protein
MAFSAKNWFKFSIVNLMIVALLGVIMRYKIIFSFPYLDQKHLLHAHSHFAFDGWTTQTLFVFMIAFLAKFIPPKTIKKYRIILIANLICAYGMVLYFSWQGYGAVSIFFATASVFTGYLFSYWYFVDLRMVPASPSKPWFNAALLFNVVSSLGTFYLAYMMATRSVNQNHYLGSLYFYLHFQYNGWFLFAAMGLLLAWLREKYPTIRIRPVVFYLFFVACIPAYFLSTLWANVPVWLYTLVVLAAIAQVVAWIIFLRPFRDHWNDIRPAKWTVVPILFLLVAFAFSIKLLLQLGSTIPSVSKLAFGFRPIVIAYLHLILLAVFSLFLLAYTYAHQYLHHNRGSVAALYVIAAGIFLNEFILLIQGVTGFIYVPVPYVNHALLFAAFTIFSGIVYLICSQPPRQVKS